MQLVLKKSAPPAAGPQKTPSKPAATAAGKAAPTRPHDPRPPQTTFRSGKKTKVKPEDWDHDLEGMEPDEHSAHIRHHEQEFIDLRRKFHGTQDPGTRDEVMAKMRKVAVHRRAHLVAKHAPGPTSQRATSQRPKAQPIRKGWYHLVDDEEPQHGHDGGYGL